MPVGGADLAAELGASPVDHVARHPGESIRYRLIEQRMAPEHIARILRQAGHL